ncbi:permease prefix domain 1-containing protein [Ornithinibacillus californiensis]|uniref:permease prefix domain 1-containing protein n=1 Tax=Ornithinibacillus californiensis TaxID=161536 RepID=UPI00064D79B5|nr:permease prefix domain 1-containing protein [Ornithinibacillus californiensis]
MKQIESYVNEVYHSVDGNKKEIEELKAEMKNHLIEAVHELKAGGKNEQEAISIAIERFGGEQEMRSIIGQLFKAQKLFAKWVLILASSILAISLSIFAFLWIYEGGNSKENSIVSTEIANVLEGKETITEDMKEEIKALVNGTDQISKVEISNGIMIQEFKYERNIVDTKGLFEFFPRESWSGKWNIKMEIRYLDYNIAMIPIIGFPIYLTLFTIWATVNAYHHRRLNIGWILAFALLNVIGYLIFTLVGKRKIAA